ncbi:MAG: phage antirepressor KilAC domain-containing protein [Pseudomonadota bacterium]
MHIPELLKHSTMTSREISELTGKDHKHVLFDIRKMFVELDEDETRFRLIYLDSMNRQQVEYALDRLLTETLLTGYSAIARRRVIARWHEFEAEAAPKVPQTMAQALRLAADQAEQLEAQAAQLAIAAPKVEFVDRFVDATGLKGFREVCKLLKANEARFREFVISEKLMYRLGSKLTAYQNHIDAGRFEVRTGMSDDDHAYTTTKFTAKGVNWIAGEWAKHQLNASGDV